MRTKRGLHLDRVVLLGRTFEEYRRYFLLEPQEMIGKTVLDVAGGVSSFCAEANNLGIKVTALDPIPILNPFTERSDSCRRILWGFYKNPDYMRALRERASAIFFSDFESHPQHYVAGELPRCRSPMASSI
jgi:hypothetical protein